MTRKAPNDAPKAPKTETVAIAFTSLAAVIAATSYVSRQPSNTRRRKGAVEGPGGIQACDRRALRRPILHHQHGWEGCLDISLRGMGADGRKAGQALELQSYEAEVFGSGELLRPGSGDGQPRPAADPCHPAGSRGREGRRGSTGQSQLSDSPQPGSLQEGNGREPVHG